MTKTKPKPWQVLCELHKVCRVGFGLGATRFPGDGSWESASSPSQRGTATIVNQHQPRASPVLVSQLCLSPLSLKHVAPIHLLMLHQSVLSLGLADNNVRGSCPSWGKGQYGETYWPGNDHFSLVSEGGMQYCRGTPHSSQPSECASRSF